MKYISPYNAFISAVLFSLVFPTVSVAQELPAPEPVVQEIYCESPSADESVGIVLLPVSENVVSGTNLMLIGEIFNKNPFPVSGTLYARVLLNPDSAEEEDQTIDQFIVAENISLLANSKSPVEHAWLVPALLPSGQYYVSYYFVTKEGFELMGSSGQEKDIASFAPFTVSSDAAAVPAFISSETEVNGERYTYPSNLVLSNSENTTVSVTLKNPTSETINVPVQWQQSAGTAVLEDRREHTQTELVALDPNESRVLTYTLKEQAYPVIVVSAMTEYKGVSSFVNVSLEQEALQKSVVTNAGLVAREGQLEVYGCVEFVGRGASNSIVEVVLVDENETVLGSFAYADLKNGRVVVNEKISLPENLYTAKLRFITKTDNIISMEEEVEFVLKEKPVTDKKMGGGAFMEMVFGNPFIFFGGTLILTLLLYLVWSVHKRHIPKIVVLKDGSSKQSGKGGTMALFILLFSASVFIAGVPAAQAQGVSLDCENTPGLTVSLYESNYSGGDGWVSANSTWMVTYGGTTDYYNGYCDASNLGIAPYMCDNSVSYTHNGLSFTIQQHGSVRNKTMGVYQATGIEGFRNCVAPPPPNEPPNPPSITGPTSGLTGTSYSFSFQASDPDGDQVRYQIDWDNNGTPDATVPGSGYVNSNTSQSDSRSWGSPVASTFQARTQDDNNATSGWVSHTITITNPPSPTADLVINGQTSDVVGINKNQNLNLSWSSANAASCTILGANLPSGSLTGQPTSGSYTVVGATQSDSYVITCSGATDSVAVTVTNQGPNPPVIDGPTTGIVSTSYTFGFTATDPNGDQIAYEVDWNNDGVVDARVPTSGLVNSNTRLTGVNSWGAAGAYTFRARTLDSDTVRSGWAQHTITISTAPPAIPATPSAPATTAGACDTGAVTVSWSPVSGATGYDVQYQLSPSGAWTTVTSVTSPRSVTGLTPGSTYNFQVRAKNVSGASAWSGFGTTNAPPDCAPAPPSIPTGLSASPQACGTNQLALDWSDASNATSYSVYYSDGTFIGNSVASNYTFTGTAGQNYSFYVRANNSVGVQSGNSTTFNGTAPAACATPPATPTGLTANTAPTCGTGTINVTWNTVSGASGYDLQINGGAWLSLGNVTTYSHTGLVAGSGHTYRVRAWNGAGAGVQSSLVNGTAPTACVTTSATGNISASGCFVSLGASTCSSSVTWDSQNANSPFRIRKGSNAPFSSSSNQPSPGVEQFVSPGGGTANTFYLYHETNVELDSITPTVTCSGGTWNGSICAGAPVPQDPNLSISANPSQVQQNGNTSILWQVGNPYAGLTCDVFGPKMTTVTNFDPLVSPSGSRSATGITAKSVYTIQCDAAGVTFTKTATVETQGVIQEI